jgi:hypothetical protein
MARREARPPAEREVRLTPRRMHCVNCQQRLWVAYHAQRTLVTFRGVVRLTLVVRRCRNQECDLYHLPYRAEEEGGCRAAPRGIWLGYHHGGREARATGSTARSQRSINACRAVG